MKVYKLFRKNMTTKKGDSKFIWPVGERVVQDYGSAECCTSGVIHYYHSAALAALINPLHVLSTYNRLFECEVDNPLGYEGLKGWSKSITIIREIELPVYTLEQRIKFAILCALEVYTDPDFIIWAKRWLSGEDRSRDAAAYAACAAAKDAADAADAAYAAYAAAAKAAYAAYATAKAANAATESFNTDKIIDQLKG